MGVIDPAIKNTMVEYSRKTNLSFQAIVTEALVEYFVKRSVLPKTWLRDLVALKVKPPNGGLEEVL